MVWAAVAIGGAAVVSYIGSQQASSAATAANNQNMTNQSNMNTQNVNAQLGMNAQNLAQQDRWNTLNNPFAASGQRQQYVGQLNSLMNDPSAMSNTYNDPVFQGQLQQGQDAVSRRMAASGQGGSGNEMASLMQYTTGNAQNAFQNKYNQLSSLSGASGPAGQASQGSAYMGSPISGMSPQTAFGMAASPYQGVASSLNMLAGIYGGQ